MIEIFDSAVEGLDESEKSILKQFGTKVKQKYRIGKYKADERSDDSDIIQTHYRVENPETYECKSESGSDYELDRKERQGKWTKKEKKAMKLGIKEFGNDYRRISAKIGSKSPW